MPLTPPFIDVQNVSFAYGTQAVLDQVTFSVQAGEYVGIVGPNGGGKSTLIKLLAGLLECSSGTIRIEGGSVRDAVRLHRLGYVPQRVAQASLEFPATVHEVVESGRIPRHGLWGRLDAADRQVIEDALDIAQIGDLRFRLMSSLSGGERQRVYVARALAAQPALLILDEPFVGVDMHTQQEFYGFLKRLNERQGLTILFVSHDIDMITKEAKAVLCLNRSVMCSGDPSLLHQSDVMNRIHGTGAVHLHHAS